MVSAQILLAATLAASAPPATADEANGIAARDDEVGGAGALVEEAGCPAMLDQTRDLVLVTTQGMNSLKARMQRFTRGERTEPWRAVGIPEDAVVGRSGLAWGLPFRDRARGNEPAKIEGDGRTPAGIYAVGRSFGFDPHPRPGHLVLKENETVCVDDPISPAYNTIAPRSQIGPKTHGEEMRRVSLYRKGLVIDYPSSAVERAGSCIFVHVWRARDRGTAGCVALPEDKVAALQSLAGTGAAIAILPVNALARFGTCLPEIVRPTNASKPNQLSRP